MRRKDPPNDYAFQVIPGLEALALEEWKFRIGNPGKSRVFEGSHRNSTILIRHGPDPDPLFSMRTVEDVFFVASRINEVPRGPSGLAAIERAVARPGALLTGASLIRNSSRRAFQRRVLYRLVTRDDGSLDFTRHAIGRHARRGLVKLRSPRWVEVGEGAQVELWLLLERRTFLCLVRLTDRSFRHRDYKTAHLPGSLRPSLGAAMVFLTEPKSRDRFVDPLCGVGTVAIERAVWGPVRHIIGGDRDAQALAYCRENGSSLRSPPDWLRWDVGQLPLPDYSVDKVASNLPFGDKHATGEDIAQMYSRVTAEVGRILRPGGRAVFLTSRKRTLRRFLNEKTHLLFERSIEVRVLGKKAFLVVAWKK